MTFNRFYQATIPLYEDSQGKSHLTDNIKNFCDTTTKFCRIIHLSLSLRVIGDEM